MQNPYAYSIRQVEAQDFDQFQKTAKTAALIFSLFHGTSLALRQNERLPFGLGST
jgi:hypothetical protein